MRTFFRAGFFTPIRSTTLIFRSSIYQERKSFLFQLPVRETVDVILSGGVYLFVGLLHFGLHVVPILVDLVDEAVELLAIFLSACEHTVLMLHI